MRIANMDAVVERKTSKNTHRTSQFWSTLLLLLLVVSLPTSHAYAPPDKAHLQAAVTACLKLSPTDCFKGPHGPIGSWDVSSVEDMSYMFDDATSFNGDISKWDVAHVTNMRSMFLVASSFDGDISKWVVSRVANMYAMFASAISFNGDISNWDVSRVINMENMFKSASSFNGDISNWDVSHVTNMKEMFQGANGFKRTLCGGWKTSLARKDHMFRDSHGKLCTGTRDVISTTTAATTTAATTTASAATTAVPVTSTALVRGTWLRTEPRDCVAHCGAPSGGGIPGSVVCPSGHCDDATKPWPKTCPKPQPCAPVQGHTVPQIEAVLNTDLHSGGQFFTVELKLNVDGAGPRTYRVLLDTGSTGLVLVTDTKKSFPVKMRNCNDNKPCQSFGIFFYTQCFADGSGYVYLKKPSVASLTLLGHTVKVGLARASLVYDPDNSMFNRETHTYTNVWGLGAHGNKACTAFDTDLLSDFTKGARLTRMFSIRSVTATGESRLYIGASHPTFESKATQAAPFLIDTHGHYRASLTGFESTTAKVKGMLTSKGEPVLLDTGSSLTVIASENAMASLLHSLKALCSSNSPWTAVTATSSYTSRDDQYRQYVCDPTSNWEKHRIAFIFGSAKTPALPVTNMVAQDSKSKQLRLRVLHALNHAAVSVLGVAFFKDNWVEINIHTQHVRFADPTAEDSQWSDWTRCPCAATHGATQTRTCYGGDGAWCSGPSSRPCPSLPGTVSACPSCPRTCNGQTCDHWVGADTGFTCKNLEALHDCDCHHCSCSMDGQVEWSAWSACSVTCGKGIQGRGTRMVKKATGGGVVLQPSGSSIRACQRLGCAACVDPGCLTYGFCLTCSHNKFQSCTSCHPGCKLRNIDDDGNQDCKGIGNWDVKDGDIVVVHGRKLRAQPHDII